MLNSSITQANQINIVLKESFSKERDENSQQRSQTYQSRNQTIEKAQTHGFTQAASNTPQGLSLKALSKQKNLLEKKQKLKEELEKKKNPGQSNLAIDNTGKNIKQNDKNQNGQKSAQDVQGKRNSKQINSQNLISLLNQKIQENEDMEKNTLKYRLRVKYQQFQEKGLILLDNKYYQHMMTLFTIFSLYSEDIRQVSTTAQGDMGFQVTELIVLLFFFFEIVLQSMCRKGYFLSFIFWMDLLSTISLFFDIDFLSKALFGFTISNSNVTVLKASRVSRIATRALKIVRFIRLLRLTKIQKLYQQAYEELNQKYDVKEQDENKSEGSVKDGKASNPQSQQNLDIAIDKQNQSFGLNQSDFQLKIKENNQQLQEQSIPKRMNSFEKTNNNNTSVLLNFYRRKSFDMKDSSQHRNSLQSFLNNCVSSQQQINLAKKSKIYGSGLNFDSANFSEKNSFTIQNQQVVTMNSPYKQKSQAQERKSIMTHVSHNSANSHDTQQNQQLQGLKRDSVKQSAFYNIAKNNKEPITATASKINIQNQKQISFLNPAYEVYKNRASDLYSNQKSKMSITSHASFGFDEEDTPLQGSSKQQQSQNKPKDQESKIGKQLADITTTRVIILIFVLVITIPFFDNSFYVDPDYGFVTYLNYVVSDYNVSRQKAIDDLYVQVLMGIEYDATDNVHRYPLKSIISENSTYFPNANYTVNTNYHDLRDYEYTTYSSNSNQQTGFAYFETQYITKIDQDLSSYLSIGQTTFILAILAYSTITFVKDINKLVVSPIERMLETIKLIADNPLDAAKISEEKAMAEQELKKNKVKLSELNEQKSDETYLLESTIMKIGALLAIGFGEAGSKIITKNMQIGGSIDPMIPGKKIMAIFGFCSIKNFADATEILQEKVMLFANEVAELVHVCCDSFHGAINKNLGDCFLLVWKYTEDESQLFLDSSDEVKLKNLPLVQNLSDLPVVAFLKAIANARLLSLTSSFKQQHLKPLQKVMKNFTFRLGFGLHVGWGIEGAIGSNFKIDASYLSPNVNMASRLENATKQYGLYFLLSGALYRLLSNKMQSALRHVDRVTVKGSKQPMDLYTCDVDPTLLTENKFVQKRLQDNKVNKKVLKFISRKRRTDRYKKILQGQANICQIIDSDVDIATMRKNYTDEFRNTYHDGLQEYLNGDWEAAKVLFEEAQMILKDTLYRSGADDTFLDGPIQTLIKYMQKSNFKAPQNWYGYRVLLDK
ncbi:adenylate/guanylate cyclase domain protein (macronuclear) [Tetrahymena thermophila SB210]|uniref:Adenylate/guanylate cyclase domain protein n=1 Tax=Tetrahymena thermophila (strain SB210) TaxID=312017 RepID=Q22CK6_TETTS|nr:adenylate/guanylate cyclase domain protein [Tetrahymena thermophila SB210]EAR83046.2 adenylate/guanylate cyclase domain protein [Tetrahymena thermophila SB210]|eukprot:XP_001030709.2 adenylate/guanylate cyclase domain protein [Tetrahymena thermophila SB210]